MAPTAADYSSIDGLKNLLSTVPELKGLLDKAIATGQSQADFQDAVESSNWWKTHSSAARQAIALKANDPAEFAKQQAQQRSQYTVQLNQLAQEYGHAWTQAGLEASVNHLLEGATTIDTYKQYLINAAKSKYPGLSTQIDSGMTVADLAQPYITSMAQTLELNPNSIKITDPSITRALQGMSGVSTKGTTTPTATPIWQFEQQLRADPRWGQTDNAKQTVSNALLKVGQDMGFVGA